MAIQINQKAYQHARELIENGQITEDTWEAPTLQDFNDNIEEYALYHLGKDPNGDPANAGTYSYPYGKNGKVYVRALRAIRAAAAGARGATPNKEIYDAAGRLMEMLPESTSKSIRQDNMILKVDKFKRIVTAPALVPYEKDADGDIVTPEQIEAVSYKFLTDYKNIDIMHTLRKVAEPVESWILREPMTIKEKGVELPAGTWMLSAKIKDDSVWDGILKGEYTGFSIAAVPVATKSVSKRTTLRDLGWPWDVVTVSIVDRPAVPKAKFVAIKREEDDESILYKIFKILEKKFRGDKMVKSNGATEPQTTKQDQQDQDQSILEAIQALQNEIEAIKEEIESIKTGIENLESEEEPEPKTQTKAQSIKGQVGTTQKSNNDLYKEIGVDRFGRPLNN